ncbi:UDP-N-acetylmuramate dehydrogenase [Pasteurella bettyae]|uniref:UDP-N-acetylenolpyruvoylglucosamine reductase n=1 Tax=Pasteurella bettyae CCUG 2042 TaxID=1095749 RepID=I3DA02_9PAST|nr:UDP-N-acetylmuramate dehydrogenase [Pasteurella bettyae]EIJ68545.1 UDP-N-acetylmuramate dehydrogenase [Pasteurella bettyae CCUG 2042]SUB22698.1 UDP-N-acetylenolpyruvoylglucosamine reductase [Pasteurella bettyae]
MQSLMPFHTFSVPASAKKIVEITALEQLQQLWNESVAEQQPVLFLGQGSNVLFLEDFQGTVLLNRLMGIEKSEDANFHYLHVNAGENWHNLVQWSLSQGIYGLENLALIPGCAGSAPVQNIGAYGREFKDFCHYVDVLDLNTGKQFRLTNAECEFGYRESVFKHKYAYGFIVIAVGLKLAKHWKPILKYGSLSNFDENTVTAKQIFDEVCSVRRAKLPNPQDFGNAGSFFKNPVISAEQFTRLQQAYPHIPNYPQADGSVKLAAGWLIDQCQLKGYQIGGAAVHQNQALVLINKAHATGADVVALAHHVRQAVADKFKVYLSPEVRFIAAQGEVNAETAIS